MLPRFAARVKRRGSVAIAAAGKNALYFSRGRWYIFEKEVSNEHT
jgi:hypothetical protein